MNIYNNILEAKKEGKKLLAVLIDPEKFKLKNLSAFINKIHNSATTHIFVGGSTDKENLCEKVVLEIKALTKLPVVLFPGNAAQVNNNADAILFLTLLSGRNPEYLIEQQIKAAPILKNLTLEIIPTGYILIDGGKQTATQIVSNTKPIKQKNEELILNTALAGEFSGKKLIYLESGSGAKFPVSDNIVNLVKNNLKIPLIVGGGIRTKEQLNKTYKSGADLVVIGTAFENNESFLNELKTLNLAN